MVLLYEPGRPVHGRNAVTKRHVKRVMQIGNSAMQTFIDLAELQHLPKDCAIAVQLGPAGGIWTRQAGTAESDGGTCFDISSEETHWRRQCDPGRLDARWFGVQADDQHDDAPALQRAIDALPATGGQVLLPSGRMRCGHSLRISRSYISLVGVNCGLLSKHFEPGKVIGQGSLLRFEGCDGIRIQAPPQVGDQRLPRLGGITLRELGIAGTGRQDQQRGIVVQPSEGRGWGSTDALLLDRVYCIDLHWAGDFTSADMSVMTNCWFSECGNGIRLRHCVYNCLSNGCIADNDGIGVLLESCKGCDLTGNIFVRNEHGLRVSGGQTLSVIGGSFETDPAGGQRHDQSLLHLQDAQSVSVCGTTEIRHGIINYNSCRHPPWLEA